MLSNGEYLIYGSSLINEFLQEIKAELIAYLDNENRNATGKSKASLQVVNITPTSGELIGSDSIKYVFEGRPAGGMPPLFAIIEWCNAKGIPRQAAYAIAKRIAEAGTALYRSGRNVLAEIINEQRINKLIESLTVLYTAEIKSDIEALFAQKV